MTDESRRARDTNTPIPLAAHAATEPLVGTLFILAPWIFGFEHVSDAKTISIVIGIVILTTAMTTRWRMAIVKVMPLSMHRAIDLILSVVAIASPYLFGFSDVGSATRFLIIIGIAQLDIAMLTRWDHADDFAAHSEPPTPAPPAKANSRCARAAGHPAGVALDVLRVRIPLKGALSAQRQPAPCSSRTPDQRVKLGPLTIASSASATVRFAPTQTRSW